MAAMLAGKPLPAQPMKKASAADVTPAPKAATLSIAPKAAAKIILPSRPVLTYPYSPYNEGRMDPQLHGWPLTAAEVAWTAKGEYFRKPGHELQKHLPEMWFVTPTAARWGGDSEPIVHANGVPAGTAAVGIKLCIDNLRQRCPQSKVVLIKVLPAFDPSKEVGEKVREINTALDALKLNADPQVQLLDLWTDFTNSAGTLNSQLYLDGHLHLNPAGYDVLASRLASIVAP
jgi:hypothetical protein